MHEHNICGGDLKARDRFVIMRHPQLSEGFFISHTNKLNKSEGDGHEQEDEWS